MAKKIIVKEQSKLKFMAFLDDSSDDMTLFELAQTVIYDKRGNLTYRHWRYNLLPEFMHDWKLFLRSIKCTNKWYISDSDFEFILRHGDLFYIHSILENAMDFERLTGKAFEHYDNLANILYIVGISLDDMES